MRFYIEANGYEKLFSSNDFPRAIHSAWNYHGDLWLLPYGANKSQLKDFCSITPRELLFCSHDPYCGGVDKYGYKVCEGDTDNEEPYVLNLKTGVKTYMDDVDLIKLNFTK